MRATALGQLSARVGYRGTFDEGAVMSEGEAKADKAVAHIRRKEPVEQVLQVERRDYTELAPTDRPRSQSLDGFEWCF